MKNLKITFITMLVALGCFTPLPEVRAISPPPDGWCPNLTTAEGCRALQNVTTGVANTGIDWYSLFATNTGSYNTAVGAGITNTATGLGGAFSNTTGQTEYAERS